QLACTMNATVLIQILSVRGLAMMSAMERLTDRKPWEKKVFDAGIVSKWCEEALA
ncbi:hypothetical protein P280DRAFT_363179, partial [Massarina eburnea CBS 473.64]